MFTTSTNTHTHTNQHDLVRESVRICANVAWSDRLGSDKNFIGANLYRASNIKRTKASDAAGEVNEFPGKWELCFWVVFYASVKAICISRWATCGAHSEGGLLFFRVLLCNFDMCVCLLVFLHRFHTSMIIGWNLMSRFCCWFCCCRFTRLIGVLITVVQNAHKRTDVNINIHQHDHTRYQSK